MQHSGKPVIARHACGRFANRPYGVDCGTRAARQRMSRLDSLGPYGSLFPARELGTFHTKGV